MVYKSELLQVNEVGTLFKLIVNFINLKHIYLTTSSEKNYGNVSKFFEVILKNYCFGVNSHLFLSSNVGASNLRHSCPFLDIFLEILMYILVKTAAHLDWIYLI